MSVSPAPAPCIPPAAASPAPHPSPNIRADSAHIQLAPYWNCSRAPEEEFAVDASAGAVSPAATTRFRLRRMEDDSDADYVSALRSLFLEYFASLGIDMAFQNVDAEVAHLPGAKYTREQGGFLYTLEVDTPAHLSDHSVSTPAATPASVPLLVACVALKDLGSGICEVKRLFVRPSWRGRDLGRMLLAQIIEVARQAGYDTVRLDTLGRFAAANALYSSFGFTRIPPYNFNPEADVLYFELPHIQAEGRPYAKGREASYQLTPRQKPIGASPPPVI